MHNVSTFEMPKFIDDGRLDLILSIIEAIKLGQEIELSFIKTETITPAGHALLFIILDTASEQRTNIRVKHLNQNKLNVHAEILKLTNETKPISGFIDIQKLTINNSDKLVYGK